MLEKLGGLDDEGGQCPSMGKGGKDRFQHLPRLLLHSEHSSRRGLETILFHLNPKAVGFSGGGDFEADRGVAMREF